jgi:hypothetical protein
MKIIHRIGLRLTDSQREELEALGVKIPEGLAIPGGGLPLFAFDVEEDHRNWPTLNELFQRWDAVDHVSTKFTPMEIDAAEWLVMRPSWHHGYPQPDEDDNGYLQATYDLTDYCKTCGSGLKQKAPFQMKAEPKWGKKGILQMNWVFDQFFVTPEVWAEVFKPHGIPCRPVTNRNGAKLKSVVQLDVSEEVSVKTEGLPGDLCKHCGRMKYLPVVRGPFPSILGSPQSAMVWSQAYFGSGASAFHGVLISKKLAHAISEHKVLGASVEPVSSNRCSEGAII